MSRPEIFTPDVFYPSGDYRAENVVVWLPAFGDSGTMTSRPYISLLEEQGWRVMVVNHDPKGFCMTHTVNEVLQRLYLVPRKRVLFVGVSFGMQIAAEILRVVKADEAISFSVISVCGVSRGEDTLRPIGWAKRFHGPIVGMAFKLLQATFITFGEKSPFDEHDKEVAASIKPHQQFRKWHFSGRALAEQLHAMATTPAILSGEFDGIPVMVISTKGDDVMLKPSAARNVAAAFSPVSRATVDLSIHADLTELPSVYWPPMGSFSRGMIQTPINH